MADPATTHSAAASMLGYLHQLRFALNHVLIGDAGDATTLALEVLDDVAFFDDQGSPVEVVQTKHHVSRGAELTDSSSDVWRTIKVWMDLRDETGTAGDARLILVTSGIVGPTSAMAHLQDGLRNVGAAEALLNATAVSSQAAATAVSRAQWLAMDPGHRRELLESATVVGSGGDIDAVRSSIEHALRWVAPREHRSTFVDYLEGWWFSRVVQQLQARDGHLANIAVREIEAQIEDLRDGFSPAGLPVAYELANVELTDAIVSSHSEHVFVRQIELVEAGAARVANAISDYYRAFAQRSRWLREDLLVDSDLVDYQRRLTEAWSRYFASVNDELGPQATDQERFRVGRTVLAWAENQSIPIRDGVAEPFISRGSFHMLADEVRIGWHPNFSELVGIAISEEAQ